MRVKGLIPESGMQPISLIMSLRRERKSAHSMNGNGLPKLPDRGSSFSSGGMSVVADQDMDGADGLDCLNVRYKKGRAYRGLTAVSTPAGGNGTGTRSGFEGRDGLYPRLEAQLQPFHLGSHREQSPPSPQ